MRVLVICPIPIEFTSCRTALSLRDGKPVLGCRTSQGSIASLEIMALRVRTREGPGGFRHGGGNRRVPARHGSRHGNVRARSTGT